MWQQVKQQGSTDQFFRKASVARQFGQALPSSAEGGAQQQKQQQQKQKQQQQKQQQQQQQQHHRQQKKHTKPQPSQAPSHEVYAKETADPDGPPPWKKQRASAGPGGGQAAKAQPTKPTQAPSAAVPKPKPKPVPTTHPRPPPAPPTDQQRDAAAERLALLTKQRHQREQSEALAAKAKAKLKAAPKPTAWPQASRPVPLPQTSARFQPPSAKAAAKAKPAPEKRSPYAVESSDWNPEARDKPPSPPAPKVSTMRNTNGRSVYATAAPTPSSMPKRVVVEKPAKEAAPAGLFWSRPAELQNAPRGIKYQAALVLPGASAPPSGSVAAASASDGAPAKGLPMTFLLCGLGEEAGQLLNLHYKNFAELAPEPFVLVVAQRHPKWWWFVDDSSDGGWVKGRLDPGMVNETVEWMQSLMEDESVDQDRTGLFGFSAGGYAALEILATGKILFSGFAVGGVHGHGQCNLDDLPVKWRNYPREKFKAFLDRIGQHEGAMWMEATHSVTDQQSKWEDASRILGALDARQKDLGMAGIQLRIVGIEEQDRAPGNKRNKTHHDYFKAAFMRREFFVALFGGDAPEDKELPDDIELIPPEEAFTESLEVVSSDMLVRTKEELAQALEEYGTVDGKLLEAAAAEESAEDEEATQGEQADGEEQAEGEEGYDEVQAQEEEVYEVEDVSEEELDVPKKSGAAALGNLAPGMKAPPKTTLDVAKYSVSSVDFNWEVRALKIFQEHGFVIVEDALTDEQCSEVLQDCQTLEKTMVTNRKGNRGPGRYSFGNASATGSMLHRRAWAMQLLEGGCGVLLPLLEQIFDADEPTGYFVQAGGGDFVLDRVSTMQDFHADINVKADYSRSTPVPPLLCVNFCVQDLTELNGAMRIAPGTQQKVLRGLTVDETGSFANSRICPVRAGAAIVRDVRAWHSGTPNVSTKTRFLPSIEFTSNHFREWCRANKKFLDRFPKNNKLPRTLYDEMSPEIQELCSKVVAPEGKDISPDIASY